MRSLSLNYGVKIFFYDSIKLKCSRYNIYVPRRKAFKKIYAQRGGGRIFEENI